MPTKNKIPKSTIIIPAYQEAENLIKLIPAIFSALPNSSIVVVNDQPEGKSDKTDKVISKLKRKFPKVHLINRVGKGGRGSAVIDGLKFALKSGDFEIFVEMDADFSHEPNELPNLIKQSAPKTVVLASRYLPTSKILNWPKERLLHSKLANLYIHHLLGTPLKDNTNGYRVYQKDAVKLLVSHRFMSKGYILLSESIYLLLKNKFKLVEISSVFKNRRRGKSKTDFKEIFNSLLAVVQIRVFG